MRLSVRVNAEMQKVNLKATSMFCLEHHSLLESTRSGASIVLS